MKGIIYKWTCNNNNKSYIGQTINEKRREKDFLTKDKPYAGEKINNARKKYGLSEGTWTKTVLKRLWCKDGKEDELRDRLNYWERYYIESYDTINNGYNTTNGGDCNFSENIIEEMRKKGKNYWNSLSDEEKNNFILVSKERNKKWFNSLSEVEKNNLRQIAKEANIGLHRGHSMSRSLHSSNIKRGIKMNEETKKKIKESLLEKNIQHKTEQKKENLEGCYFIPRINRWRSTIYYNGGKRLLGHFETAQAASDIRKIAKEKKEEGTFEEWYQNIQNHKIEIFKKYNEKMCN